MQIVQAEFRRIRNLGNYENAELKLVAVVEEGEDCQAVVQELRKEVALGLGFKAPKLIGESTTQTETTKAPESKASEVETTTETEVEEPTKPLGEMDVKELKALADKRKIEYPKGARTSGMLKLLQGGEASKTSKNEATTAKEYTLADVKAQLKEVCKKRGIEVGKDIVKDFGVAKSDEINPADYPKVMQACKSCLS